MLNEVQAQRLAVLLTDQQRTDILTLAQVIERSAPEPTKEVRQ